MGGYGGGRLLLPRPAQLLVLGEANHEFREDIHGETKGIGIHSTILTSRGVNNINREDILLKKL